MQKTHKQDILLCTGLFAAFALWTAAVSFVDVRAIGPRGSSVGFGALNGYIHSLFGVNMTLYTVTDWLGLIPVTFMFGFAVLGLVQLIKRKSIARVDGDILLLGAFYIILTAFYLLFEKYAVNYRPVLIDGFLEASYPSSTTLLVLCVIPTAILQFRTRIKSRTLVTVTAALLSVFAVFMTLGRLVSGVHWFTDIIGGALLSAALTSLYRLSVNAANRKKSNKE